MNPAGATYSERTPRLSDFLPDHFRAFAEAATSPPSIPGSDWDDLRSVVQATLGFAQSSYAPTTGLVPDFMQPVSQANPTLRPADAGFLESPWDGDYYYNSTRVPLRVAIDALLNDDSTSRGQVTLLSNWAEAASQGDPALLRAGYTLDGEPLPGSNYFTTAFSAPLGAAAMNVPSQQQWLNQLYDTARVSDEDYYEDTLSLLSLVVMTGNCWSPTTFGASQVPTLAPIGIWALELGLTLLGVRALRSSRRTTRAKVLGENARRLFQLQD